MSVAEMFIVWALYEKNSWGIQFPSILYVKNVSSSPLENDEKHTICRRHNVNIKYSTYGGWFLNHGKVTEFRDGNGKSPNIYMLPPSLSGSYGSPDEGLTVDVRMETLN